MTLWIGNGVVSIMRRPGDLFHIWTFTVHRTPEATSRKVTCLCGQLSVLGNGAFLKSSSQWQLKEF